AAGRCRPGVVRARSGGYGRGAGAGPVAAGEAHSRRGRPDGLVARPGRGLLPGRTPEATLGHAAGVAGGARVGPPAARRPLGAVARTGRRGRVLVVPARVVRPARTPARGRRVLRRLG